MDMSDIGAVLREEIQRLAGRVSRQADRRLKKDVVRMKHQIAELNRQVAGLRRDNAKLIADLRGRLAAPPSAGQGALEGARLSPRFIRARRKRLGLSQGAFARLLGVSAGAVLAWEGGRSKPRAAARAALVAVRELGRREALWRLEALDRKGRRTEVAKAR
ncbi:MAG: helix-turn-helix domain-containing protein [Elusimicrobia bacterium]|nr:helix-turn-helix domain-containing protein [Elusimicrobiota bacterium]